MTFLPPASRRPLAGGASVAAVLLLVSGCGGGTAPASVEGWSDYCIATFTESYPVLDPFGDVDFTIAPGDEYVIASFDSGSAPELLYLHTTGPYSVTIDTNGAPLPFTSNCTADSTSQHYAVFSDVTVYADEELTTPICDLPAGTVLPRDQTAGAGYGITSSRVGNSVTYQVILNSFAADCGGAAEGYVSVPETVVFGTHTWLVPIQMIVGPA